MPVEAPTPDANPPAVDPAVDDMVEDAISAMQGPPKLESRPSIPPEIGSAEIDVSDLGDDAADELARTETAREQAEPDVIQTKSAAHISDDEFDKAPRAPGVVTVPPPQGEQHSGSSLLAISTLIKLGEILGHEPSTETKALDEAQARVLRTLIVDGKWPENEELTRRVMIVVIREAIPSYTRSDHWQKKPFKELKRLFLDELAKSEIRPLAELAILLRSSPPPMPKAPRPDRR